MKVRKASGCVVVRKAATGLEYLLVTSTSGRGWVFPKGGVEPDLMPETSAVKEVYEEAGVTGRLYSRALGTYRYLKKGVINEVTMFLMEYGGDTDDWPERHKRQRAWYNRDSALSRLDQYLAVLILDAETFMEGQ